MHSLTIGADPEIFLVSKNDGKYISAVNKIGGTKRAPRHLERVGFALQEDNVAVEFNIPPAETLEAFVESIEWSIRRISDEVECSGYGISIIPAAHFPESELQHPQAQYAGCDPDFNAWTGKRNPKPPVAEGTLRTGAGHVHVGIKPIPDFSRRAFIKSLDLNLGVPSVVLDSDTLRKNLYGKAGAYRPTNYGVEYRVLSNFWLTSRNLTEWVYKQTHNALAMIEREGESFFDSIGSEIKECIDTSNTIMSRQLMKRFNIAGI